MIFVPIVRIPRPLTLSDTPLLLSRKLFTREPLIGQQNHNPEHF